MSVIEKMRRLAAHRERIAKIELANAEGMRAKQEALVEQTSAAILGALGSQSADPLDPVDQQNRHGYALRMEMERRSAARALSEREREVEAQREQVTAASRETGTYERLLERRAAAQQADRARIEQRQLDEAGLASWWLKEE